MSAANAMPANLFNSLPFRAQRIDIHGASSMYMPTTPWDLLPVPSVQMLISDGAGASESGLLFSMQMEAAPLDEMPC